MCWAVQAWLTYRLGGAVDEAGQWVAVAPAVQVIPAQSNMGSDLNSSILQMWKPDERMRMCMCLAHGFLSHPLMP
jgi:hypothetical protein